MMIIVVSFHAPYALAVAVIRFEGMKVYEHTTDVIELSHGRRLYVPLHAKTVITREQMQAKLLKIVPDAKVMHYCDLGERHGMAVCDEDDPTEQRPSPSAEADS